MPFTTPSPSTCPSCNRPHRDLSPEAVPLLTALGLTPPEIAPLLSEGEQRATLPLPGPKPITPSFTATLLALGLAAGEIDELRAYWAGELLRRATELGDARLLACLAAHDPTALPPESAEDRKRRRAREKKARQRARNRAKGGTRGTI